MRESVEDSRATGAAEVAAEPGRRLVPATANPPMLLGLKPPPTTCGLDADVTSIPRMDATEGRGDAAAPDDDPGTAVAAEGALDAMVSPMMPLAIPLPVRMLLAGRSSVADRCAAAAKLPDRGIPTGERDMGPSELLAVGPATSKDSRELGRRAPPITDMGVAPGTLLVKEEAMALLPPLAPRARVSGTSSTDLRAPVPGRPTLDSGGERVELTSASRESPAMSVTTDTLAPLDC